MTRTFRLALVLPALLLHTGCSLLAQEVQPTISKDVVYGTADGQDLKLDVCAPGTPGPHPALLLIHGGGWTGGSKDGQAGTAKGLVRYGLVVFSVEYRFAPTHPWPAQILDCARAIRWVRANAAKYGVDPERVGAWGSSAGGHLSLMLGVINPGDYQSPDDPNRALSAKVKWVVDLFGPTDLRVLGADGTLTKFIGAPLGEAADKYADASPISHATRDASPVLFVHGDADTLVPLQQSQVMKVELDKLGVENELVVVKNGGHNLDGADDKDKTAAYGAMGRWLRAHLK